MRWIDVADGSSGSMRLIEAVDDRSSGSADHCQRKLFQRRKDHQFGMTLLYITARRKARMTANQ